MFCPNCGGKSGTGQNFCRTCGLKLDSITHAVAEQRPSKEYAELQRRKERFEKLGLVSISISALIGIALLFSKAVYYKLILFGPEVLFWSAFGALIFFGLLSVFFFNYPTVVMNFDKVNPRLEPEAEELENPTTQKLIEDRPFEPVPSVTEGTTELLTQPASRPDTKR
jgi:hypothetical protein